MFFCSRGITISMGDSIFLRRHVALHKKRGHSCFQIYISFESICLKLEFTILCYSSVQHDVVWMKVEFCVMIMKFGIS